MRDKTSESYLTLHPWLKYLISIAVTGVIVLLYLWGMGFFRLEAPLDKVRMFSDGCFTVGVLTACVGALFFVSQNGVFDGITYSMKQFVWFFRIQGFSKHHESYHEYKARLAAKPKVKFFHIVAAGLFWIVVAAIFVVIFTRMEAGMESFFPIFLTA